MQEVLNIGTILKFCFKKTVDIHVCVFVRVWMHVYHFFPSAMIRSLLTYLENLIMNGLLIFVLCNLITIHMNLKGTYIQSGFPQKHSYLYYDK
jgi:hypothetical protein